MTEPIGRSSLDKPVNVFPHILRNKEYTLDWLKFVLTQRYLDERTLRDIRNRIKEIEENTLINE